jgi:putative peptidoglycan lipid II flippase
MLSRGICLNLFSKSTERLRQVRSSQSVNGSIFRAVAVVGAASLVVKLMSTAKELAVAGYYGRSDMLDAYLIALLVPAFLINLIGGSFNAALIPTFIEVREQQGKDAAQQLFSNVMILSQGLLISLSVATALCAPWMLRIVASGFSPAKTQLTCHLLYLLLPLVVINGLVSIWAAVLNAGEHFLFAALTPLSTPLLSLVGVVGFGRVWGAWGYAAGTLAGGVLEAVLLARALQRKQIKLLPRWRGMDQATRKVCRQWSPVLAGAFLIGGVGFVDQGMAGMLPPGSVAALSYGSRIVALVSTMVAGSLSTAVIPYFSAMVANSDFDGCRHTLRTYRRLALLVSVPITVLLVVFSRPLIHLLYQRGAFTSSDTMLVSHVQALYSLQIPFFAVSMLHVRMLSALKRNDIMMYAAGVNLSLDILFNLICMRWWGVAGIALSTSLFYMASCAFVVFSANRILRQRTEAAQVAHKLNIAESVAFD